MNYTIDVEKIFREEARKILLENLAATTSQEVSVSIPHAKSKKSKPQLHASLDKDGTLGMPEKVTRVSVIVDLKKNQTHTFYAPKGRDLSKFRDSVANTADYAFKKYGNKYRTHRVEGGLQITRVS